MMDSWQGKTVELKSASFFHISSEITKSFYLSDIIIVCHLLICQLIRGVWRDPNNLNWLASPLVRAPCSWSGGGYEFEFPRQILVRRLKLVSFSKHLHIFMIIGLRNRIFRYLYCILSLTTWRFFTFSQFVPLWFNPWLGPKEKGRVAICETTEPVFANLLRSPRIDSQTGGMVRQPYLLYRPARLHRLAKSIPRNRFPGSFNVIKYGLW